jgi:outer membrane cobalamin receptor
MKSSHLPIADDRRQMKTTVKTLASIHLKTDLKIKKRLEAAVENSKLKNYNNVFEKIYHNSKKTKKKQWRAERNRISQ